MANSVANSSNTTQPTEELTFTEVLSSPLVTTWCILLLLLLVLIMAGNLTVIRAVYMTPKLHYSAFYFVVSLAVADFMLGFLVPFSVVHTVAQKMKNRWIAGPVACDLWTFANIWLVVASLLNLCVVSWDRYAAVTSPFSYKLRMRGRRVKILIAFVWLASLTVGILYTVAYRFSTSRKLCEATGLRMSFTLSFFIIVYAIPTLFLLFVNAKVIVVARKHRRHIRAMEFKPTWITEGDTEIRNDRRKAVFLNEVKTFKTLVIVIGTFVVCYSPFFIMLLLQNFIPLPDNMSHITVILFYVKSALNPMIYGVSSKDLRVAAANSLRRRRRIATDVSDHETQLSASVLPIPEEKRVPSPLNIDDIIPKPSNQPSASVLPIPEEKRVPSPLNIDDIIPKPH